MLCTKSYSLISCLKDSLIIISKISCFCNHTSLLPLDYNDISVDCGTNYISLIIQICPAIYAGYNETSLFVNGITNDPNCKGTVDNSVVPPVLRFNFPIGTNNSCGGILNVRKWLFHTTIYRNEHQLQLLRGGSIIESCTYYKFVTIITYRSKTDMLMWAVLQECEKSLF